MGDSGLEALLRPITFSNYVDENYEILEPVARRPLRALRLSGFGLGLPGLCKLIHAMEHGRDRVLSQLERLDLGHNPDIGDDGVTMLVERAKEARREAQAGSGAVADWASGIRELVLDYVGLEGQALAVGFQHHGIFPRLRTVWAQRSQYCFAMDRDDCNLLMAAKPGLEVPGKDEFANNEQRRRWGWEENFYPRYPR